RHSQDPVHELSRHAIWIDGGFPGIRHPSMSSRAPGPVLDQWMPKRRAATVALTLVAIFVVLGWFSGRRRRAHPDPVRRELAAQGGARARTAPPPTQRAFQ